MIRPWWAALGLVGLVLALYAVHILWAGWVYEDVQWTWAMTAPIALGHPRSLSNASWRLTATPQSAHLFSVGLHLLVVALVAGLAHRLRYSRDGVTVVALLMAVHPLTVQAVAYAAARGDLLAAVGVVIAVLAVVEWRWWSVIGLVVGAGVGWLSKESAIVLVGLVPLTVLLRTRRPMLIGGVIGLCLLGTIALDWSGVRAYVNMGEAPGMQYLHWWPWLLLQSSAAFREIGLFLFPVGLTVDYDYDLVPIAFRVVALCGLAGLPILALLVYRRRPLVAYGLLWTLISVAPRLIIQTPRSYLNDPHFYVALIGLILAAGAWWDGWCQDAERAV